MLCSFSFRMLLLLPMSLAAAGQTTAWLRTHDTAIQLAAGPTAPRVVSLAPTGEHEFVNTIPETFIDSADMAGQSLPLRWQFNSGRSEQDSHHVRFVYDSQSPRLRLIWEWQARSSSGPIEHQIHIENLDSRGLWLPLQQSFQFSWKVGPQVSLEHCYVEKGAGAPSQLGTHRTATSVGYKWRGTSSTYAHPKPNEPREIIPWFLVQRTDPKHSGWYLGVEFSGRTQLALERDSEFLHGTVGLNPEPGPFRTHLEPGQGFDTPTVFVGASRGGLDNAGNVLRHWVRKVLGNPSTWANPSYPLVVNNSWGGGMAINESMALAMIHDASALGFEMFHLDAGWFRGVGDWYPNPTKFPHGLAAIADEAHRGQMKFGLWVDWTQAGLDHEPGALNAEDPQVRDWMVTDLPPGWKPEEFKGQTIDLGLPAAQAWAQREVERIVGDYHLDMLEHDGYLVAQGCDRTDHPHAPPDNWNKCIYRDNGSYWVDSSNSADVSYHAVAAYYNIHSNLRKRYPGLLLEICNDGGRMVDFGSAAHADYFSITDSYDPLSNRRAFYDASHVLPSAMLESYVEKWPAPRLENFIYMLRSGMMGWLTVMIDTNSWTPEQHAAAQKELQLYKTQLRPLIRDADLYHISARPDGIHWDGIEYFDPKRGLGAVYAFRGSTPSQSRHRYILSGLQPARKYRLHFHDHSGQDYVATGHELMLSGLKVALPLPNSSELIFLSTLD